MNSLTHLLSKSKELRERASALPWDDKPASREWRDNRDANSDYIRNACNTQETFEKIIECAVVALEFYAEGCVDHDQVKKYITAIDNSEWIREKPKIYGHVARKAIEKINALAAKAEK